MVLYLLKCHAVSHLSYYFKQSHVTVLLCLPSTLLVAYHVQSRVVSHCVYLTLCFRRCILVHIFVAMLSLFAYPLLRFHLYLHNNQPTFAYLFHVMLSPICRFKSTHVVTFVSCQISHLFLLDYRLSDENNEDNDANNVHDGGGNSNEDIQMTLMVLTTAGIIIENVTVCHSRCKK